MKLSHSTFLLLTTVVIVTFIDGLDSSIVNICLPVIAETFHVDVGTVSWVSFSYLLFIAGTTLIFGIWASKGNLKKLFIVGLLIFGISTFFCGCASNLLFLIIIRCIQGISAGILIACSPIICVKNLPTDSIGFSVGLLTAASCAGSAFGPALGGFIIQFTSLKWIFWIDIPLIILSVFISVKFIPKSHPHTESDKQHQSFDVHGAILIFLAILSGSYFLESLSEISFTTPNKIISLILCIVSIVFLVIHFHKEKNPIINIKLFKSWKFSCTFVSYMIRLILYNGFSYLLPFYFINQFHMNSLTIGTLMLMIPIFNVTIAALFGKWSDTYGRRRFCVISYIMMIAVSVILTVYNPSGGLIPVIIALILCGLSSAIGASPCASQVIDQVPEDEKESGLSIIVETLYLSMVIAIALYASLFTLLTSKNGMTSPFAELSPDLFLYGFQVIMGIGIVLSLISLILSAIVRDKQNT